MPARLHLETWGEADLPVLLCLHGLGGGTHFFAALGMALAAQCHTVAVDLPGSGHSPLLSSFSFDETADVLVDLATEMSTPAPAVYLLGHSMGAILALEMIRRAPNLATGLIMVGGLPEPQPASRSRIRERADRIRQRGLTGLGEEAVASNFSARSQRERPEVTSLFAKLFERQDPAGYVATAYALAAWTARPLPPLDDVAVLAMTGYEDRYCPPDALQTFARTLPESARSARLEVITGCGHLPFLERPETFNAIVSDFLRRENEARGLLPRD